MTRNIEDYIDVIVDEVGSQPESSKSNMNSDDEERFELRSTNMNETNSDREGEEACMSSRPNTPYRYVQKEHPEKFEISMIGEFSFFLDLQITKSPYGVFISQSKYLKETLKKFEIEYFKPISTPMTIGYKLCKEDGALQVNQTDYRSMIIRLLYLTTSTTKVMQEVGIMARFQDFPQEGHVVVINRIFKYLQGTIEYGLWYAKSEYFKKKTYIDTNWDGSLDDRKGTSGAACFLGKCLVSWVSKK
eukprot:PITA_13935